MSRGIVSELESFQYSIIPPSGDAERHEFCVTEHNLRTLAGRPLAHSKSCHAAGYSRKFKNYNSGPDNPSSTLKLSSHAWAALVKTVEKL